MTLGEKVAACRREKGLTQEELGAMLGVSPQAVSKWENDISAPDISLLLPLADILGVTTDELLRKGPIPRREPPAKSKKLRIVVESDKGETTNVFIPLSMAQAFGHNGWISGLPMDLDDLIRQAQAGEIVLVETDDGDRVRISIE